MIVVAGESLIDLVVRADESIGATLGGGPFNVARALGRLGVPVAFVGRLSTDAFGRRLRAALEADGVDLSLTRSTDDPTMLAIAELDAAGGATYRFHSAGTAAAGFLASDVPHGLPAGVTALHVGTLGLVLEPVGSTIETMVATVGDDVLVMADPNIRPTAIADPKGYRDRLARVLARVDVLKVSVDDLAWLAPRTDPERAAANLVREGPAIALVTDGKRPVRVVAATGTTAIPVPAVKVADTIGAGDAFCAGFLAAWSMESRGRADLTDRDAVIAATRVAVAVGSATTMREGADPPRRADLPGVIGGW